MNYFFDSSALIKLYHPELGSQQIAAMFGNGGFQSVEEGAAAVAETRACWRGRSRDRFRQR